MMGSLAQFCLLVKCLLIALHKCLNYTILCYLIVVFILINMLTASSSAPKFPSLITATWPKRNLLQSSSSSSSPRYVETAVILSSLSHSSRIPSFHRLLPTRPISFVLPHSSHRLPRLPARKREPARASRYLLMVAAAFSRFFSGLWMYI